MAFIGPQHGAAQQQASRRARAREVGKAQRGPSEARSGPASKRSITGPERAYWLLTCYAQRAIESVKENSRKGHEKVGPGKPVTTEINYIVVVTKSQSKVFDLLTFKVYNKTQALRVCKIFRTRNMTMTARTMPTMPAGCAVRIGSSGGSSSAEHTFCYVLPPTEV